MGKQLLVAFWTNSFTFCSAISYATSQVVVRLIILHGLTERHFRQKPINQHSKGRKCQQQFFWCKFGNLNSYLFCNLFSFFFPIEVSIYCRHAV